MTVCPCRLTLSLACTECALVPPSMTWCRPIYLLAVMVALTGCVIPIPVPEGTPGSIQIDSGDPCGAEGLQDFVGQDESVVLATTFRAPGPIRVIRPGEMVTEEFLPERVSFQTDVSGTVVAVDCG